MNETGHAFTYLLLKESDANGIINVLLVAYVKIEFKNLKR